MRAGTLHEVDVGDDPRLPRAIEQFNAGEYEQAADAFEELFFEAVRDEVEFVRVFLQISTGIHHIERGQLRAAVERLEEGLRAIERVTNDRGYDFAALGVAVRELIPRIRRREPIGSIVVTRRS